MARGSPTRPAESAPVAMPPELQKDIAAYEANLKLAEQRVVAAFDTEIERVAANEEVLPNERLKQTQALKDEKTAFETKGRIPWSQRMRTASDQFLAAIRENRKKLLEAFTEAARSSLHKKDSEKAKEIQAAQQEALQPKVLAVWNYTHGGTTQRWEFLSDQTARPVRATWLLNGTSVVVAGPDRRWTETRRLSSNGKSLLGPRGQKLATLVEDD
jgi:hypothetical protein